jgi:predicted HicB family RNase H-like nuclease
MMPQSRKNGKSLKFPLRFKTRKQKMDAQEAADKDGRSLNSYILRLLDAATTPQPPKN